MGKVIFLAGVIVCLGFMAHGQEVSDAASHDHVDTFLIGGAMGLLSLTLLSAHLAAPGTYHFQTNTISDLGAQNYNNAWIMRSGTW
jgi:phosphate/sulfate permease